jgi:hypothetical protein
MSVSFHDRLSRMGIPSIWDDYGPGGHRWGYWVRDLKQTLPALMAVFAHPKPPPASFGYTAVEPSYGVYGWSVAVRRRALEFSTLHVVSTSGFRLAGSGSATVTTAPLFHAGDTTSIVVRDASGTHRRAAKADKRGRLRIALNLGPSNRYQEYTPLGEAVRRRSVTAGVRIGPAR